MPIEIKFEQDNLAEKIKLTRKNSQSLNTLKSNNDKNFDSTIEKIMEKFEEKNENFKDFNYFMNTWANISSSIEYLEISESLRFSVKQKLELTEKILNNAMSDSRFELLNLKKLADDLYNDVSDVFRENNLELKNYLPSDNWWRTTTKFGTKISQSKIFAQKCQIDDNSDWMSHLDNSQKLKEIVIPGSHDSGSYSMCPVYEMDIFGKMATTQKATVKEQLQSGVRMLDWRMTTRKDCLMFYHGPVTGGNVLSDIKDVCDFLHNHKDEIVIMRIKANEKSLDKFFESSVVKNELLPMVFDTSSIENKNFEDLTLSELKKGHKTGTVIILLDKGFESKYKMCFPLSTIYSKYNKKTRTSEKNAIMIDHEIENLKTLKNKDEFISCSPLNTSSVTKTILHSMRSMIFMPETETSIYPLLNASKNLKSNVDKLLNEIDQNNIRLNCINLDGVGIPEVQECINNIILRNKLPESYKADLTNSTNKG